MWILIIFVVVVLIYVIKNSASKELPKVDCFTEVEKQYESNNLKFENEKTYFITGLHVDGRKDFILKNLSLDSEVKLIHEKNNSYDSDAIMVKCGSKIIGYIKSEDCLEIHEFLDKVQLVTISNIELDYLNFLEVSINVFYN